MTKIKFINRLALIAIFSLALTGPSLKTASGVKTRADAENRELQRRPVIEWTLRGLIRYPSLFESYFNDNFGFRYNFIRLYNRALFYLNGARESTRPGRIKVIYGKQGWLYYTNDKLNEDFEGRLPLTESQLLWWNDDIARKKEWLSKVGVRYLVVFAPDKQTVYPEFVPSFLKKGAVTQREQLMPFLQKNFPNEILDLTPALLEEKKENEVFYHLDTHWNKRGAFVAYEQIAARLKKWFPTISPVPEKEITVSQQLRKRADLTDLLSLSDLLREEEPILSWNKSAGPASEPYKLSTSYQWPSYLDHEKGTVFTNPKGTGVAVMMTDSFGGMIPFLAEHFRRFILVPTDQGKVDLETLKKVYAGEKPDLIIEERTERYIKYGPSSETAPLFTAQ